MSDALRRSRTCCLVLGAVAVLGGCSSSQERSGPGASAPEPSASPTTDGSSESMPGGVAPPATNDVNAGAAAGDAPAADEIAGSDDAPVVPGTDPVVPAAGEDGLSDFVEDHRDDCALPELPAVSALPSVAALPDPFTRSDGTPVTTRAEWTCQREAIAAQFERYEFGDKPRQPDRVTGSLAGDTLTIQVQDEGTSLSFDVQIARPAGDGPFPALITFGGNSLGAGTAGLPIATIRFDNFGIASDGNAAAHGGGPFYAMYGARHSAGAMMAWAWGVSRIIDALEATPAAGIDVSRIGVTGCSRNGKGALLAGAFDQRVALTIPQEAGGGGASSWRVIAFNAAQGANIEQLSNAAGGTNWFTPTFNRDFAQAVDRTPVDHHQLEGMVAPRGLLVIENTIDWLGPDASYQNNEVAREIFAALGASEAHTYSLSGGHTHCELPQSQAHWVQSYIQKYLLGGEGEPSAIEVMPAGHTFDRARWIDWTTPDLR